jgi:hypothetical protein
LSPTALGTATFPDVFTLDGVEEQRPDPSSRIGQRRL